MCQCASPGCTNLHGNETTDEMLERVHVADALRRENPTRYDVEIEGRTTRHPNSSRFHAILHELAELHDRKQADYGRGDDPFANVRASEAWGIPAWVGAMVRANDKIHRLQSLIANGALANESAEDSLRDIAVYAAIALVLFEQAKAEAA